MLFPADHMVNDTYGIMQVRPCFPIASGIYTYWHAANSDIYTYFVHTVRIYVISGPGSRYLTTLLQSIMLMKGDSEVRQFIGWILYGTSNLRSRLMVDVQSFPNHCKQGSEVIWQCLGMSMLGGRG